MPGKGLPAALCLLACAGPAAAQGEPPQQTAAAATALDTVTISGNRQADSSYGADSAASATKTDTPLLKTPQSIAVVTRELMDDQKTVRLEEVLRDVAGVMPGGYYGSYDFFRIRGFDASGFVNLDGLSVSKNDVMINRELYGLEQVDIIKGPASTLYGSGPPGGLVNLVSKRPQRGNFFVPEFDAGSFGYYQPALDANAVLDRDGTLYGRLNLLYRSQDDYVDFAHWNRLYLAPALTWDLGPRTQLTLLTSYQRDDNHMGFPLPAVGTVLYNPNGTIPVSRYEAEPAQPARVREWAANAGYELSHRLDQVWTLRQNLRYTWDRFDWDDILYPEGLSANLRDLDRDPYFRAGRLATFGADSSALASFSLWRMQHTVLLGIDYYNELSDAVGTYVATPADPGLPLDLFTPQYGAVIPPRPANLGPQIQDNTRQLGFYAQDQVELSRAWTLTLGGREDRASTEAQGAGQTPHKFSPRAGLTWEFQPGLAAYFNYSQSFLPQSGSLVGGAPIQPETGRNLEAGLKGDLYQGRLRFTAAVYQLKRDNVATSIPTDPGFYTQSGEQRSRGFELDAALRPLAGWDLSLAYAYTDAKVLSDLDALAIGQPLRGVPRNSASAWSRYTLRDGALRGLGFGAGGNYYSRQAGCDPTTLSAGAGSCGLPAGYGESFDLPSYVLLNAALYYQRGPLRLQLNASNLLDRTYYSGSYNALYVSYGTPRTLLGSLSYRW
jgi:iron complex outermembrane recepter protein